MPGILLMETYEITVGRELLDLVVASGGKLTVALLYEMRG